MSYTRIVSKVYRNVKKGRQLVSSAIASFFLKDQSMEWNSIDQSPTLTLKNNAIPFGKLQRISLNVQKCTCTSQKVHNSLIFLLLVFSQIWSKKIGSYCRGNWKGITQHNIITLNSAFINRNTCIYLLIRNLIRHKKDL